MSFKIGNDGSIVYTDSEGGKISISPGGSLSITGPGGGEVSIPFDSDGNYSLSLDLGEHGSLDLQIHQGEDGSFELDRLKVSFPTVEVGNIALSLSAGMYVEVTPDGLNVGVDHDVVIFGMPSEEFADLVYDVVGDSNLGQTLSLRDKFNDYRASNGDLQYPEWLAKNRHPTGMDRAFEKFKNAVTWAPSHDPLALDLDGDGIETLGESDTRIFDHTGENLVNGTGWLRGGDAFLVYDRNENGLIDNGGELFGVDTVMSSGRKANSGFEALSDFDSNHDGVIDASDVQFSSLKVWLDADEDAVTDTGELSSLSDLGIVSINLNPSGGAVNLWNGNSTTGSASFLYSNG